MKGLFHHRLLAWRLLAAALLFCTPAFATNTNANLQFNRSECQVNGMTTCGKLDNGTHDSLLQTDLFEDNNTAQRTVSRNICRFVDNTSGKDLLIPLKDSDFVAFENASDALGVVVDKCCPAKTVRLTASDGQYVDVAFDIGRDLRTGARTETLNHTFNLSRQDCTTHFRGTQTCNTVTWQETVTAEATCDAEEWTTENTTTFVHGGVCVSNAWVAGSVAASAIPAACAPAYIGPENCPPTRTHGELWWQDSGNGSYDMALSCPSGTGYTRQHYTTQIEIRCWDGTAAPTGTTQNVNTSSSTYCPPNNVDIRVQASDCYADGWPSATYMCISNGSSCVNTGWGPPSANHRTEAWVGGSDTFCSVESYDTGSHWALSHFDLSGALAGRTGWAQVIIAYQVPNGTYNSSGNIGTNSWDTAELGLSAANPSFYQLLNIPDVDGDAVINIGGGISSGSWQFVATYTGYNRQLVVQENRAGPWRKANAGGPVATIAKGIRNAKVWGTVRVAAPWLGICSSTAYSCVSGDAVDFMDNGDGVTGTYTWNCNAPAGNASCSVPYDNNYYGGDDSCNLLGC